MAGHSTAPVKPPNAASCCCCIRHFPILVHTRAATGWTKLLSLRCLSGLEPPLLVRSSIYFTSCRLILHKLPIAIGRTDGIPILFADSAKRATLVNPSLIATFNGNWLMWQLGGRHTELHTHLVSQWRGKPRNVEDIESLYKPVHR